MNERAISNRQINHLIGKELKNIREDYSISVKSIKGLKAQTVSRIENGYENVTFEQIEIYADFLEANLKDLYSSVKNSYFDGVNYYHNIKNDLIQNRSCPTDKREKFIFYVFRNKFDLANEIEQRIVINKTANDYDHDVLLVTKMELAFANGEFQKIEELNECFRTNEFQAEAELIIFKTKVLQKTYDCHFFYLLNCIPAKLNEFSKDFFEFSLLKQKLEGVLSEQDGFGLSLRHNLNKPNLNRDFLLYSFAFHEMNA